MDSSVVLVLPVRFAYNKRESVRPSGRRETSPGRGGAVMELDQQKSFLLANSLARHPFQKCLLLHVWALCRAIIGIGDKYRDGGFGRRAHEVCVQATLTSPEK